MRALRRSPTSSASSIPKNNSGSSHSNSSPPVSSSGSPTSGALASASNTSPWVHLRSVLFVVASSSPASSCSSSSSSSDRGRKSPWSRRKRRHALSPRQWRNLFTAEGNLRDGGAKLLKKVRSGGVDSSIRAEVWPFILGVYDLNSSQEQRESFRNQKRKEYDKLRRRCQRVLRQTNENTKSGEISGTNMGGDSGVLIGDMDSSSCDDVVSARESLSSEDRFPDINGVDNPTSSVLEEDDNGLRQITNCDASVLNGDSSYSDSSEESEVIYYCPSMEDGEEDKLDAPSKGDSSPFETELRLEIRANEDFSTWQRIIRLDAVRASSEWVDYAPSKATISVARAHRSAEAVGLKDYHHLEPFRIFHAARLVAILEAYALYDHEIGYCQGMSDLLSPIVTVIADDHDAFWCFVGFMRKARHNFRLDEEGIRRQLNIVSKIIKCKDSHLFRHLKKVQAEDCFFVYRMVVVLFRRELSFEQTLCLWEVMWADQAAIRAGIGKSAWSRIRQKAPPTDDLLLYAIAASVLQRRKLIIEKYSCMDEIIRECNNMAGHLDVWKLLDDAHNLVVTLHDKI